VGVLLDVHPGTSTLSCEWLQLSDAQECAVMGAEHLWGLECTINTGSPFLSILTVKHLNPAKKVKSFFFLQS
jgi:hypothetical protein